MSSRVGARPNPGTHPITRTGAVISRIARGARLYGRPGGFGDAQIIAPLEAAEPPPPETPLSGQPVMVRMQLVPLMPGYTDRPGKWN